jgi:hypothetical protein
MNTKTMTFMLAVWLWPLSTGAQHDHSAGGAPAHREQTEAPPAAHGSMHEHMETMREQMARIRATEDPAERERLMQEHMRSMEEHMRTMMARAPSSSGNDEAPATRCADGDMQCRMRELESREQMRARSMSSMEERMSHMQEMMGQMMEHLREQEPSRDEDRRERRR